jgi:hypothetical protein
MDDFSVFNNHTSLLEPALPSAARLRAGRSAVTVHVHDHRNDHSGAISATTTRGVTITLRRR